MQYVKIRGKAQARSLFTFKLSHCISDLSHLEKPQSYSTFQPWFFSKSNIFCFCLIDIGVYCLPIEPFRFLSHYISICDRFSNLTPFEHFSQFDLFIVFLIPLGSKCLELVKFNPQEPKELGMHLKSPAANNYRHSSLSIMRFWRSLMK